MKLYATVSSERATKGQGGNNQVEVLLQVGHQEKLEVGRLVMTCEGDKYQVYYYPIISNCREQELNSGRVLLYETKGEKKKSELEKRYQETEKEFLGLAQSMIDGSFLDEE